MTQIHFDGIQDNGIGSRDESLAAGGMRWYRYFAAELEAVGEITTHEPTAT